MPPHLTDIPGLVGHTLAPVVWTLSAIAGFAFAVLSTSVVTLLTCNRRRRLS